MADESRTPLADIIVGDRFWLAYAQDAVRGAVKAAEARAAAIASAIAWFWTVYSARRRLGNRVRRRTAAHPARRPGWRAECLADLCVLEGVGGGAAIAVPLRSARASRDRACVPEAAGIKKASLRSAEFWTGAAAVLVVLGLSAVFLLPAPGRTSLTALFDPTDSARLLVAAEVARDTMVTFAATAASTPAGAHSSAVTLARANEEGLASATLRVNPGAHRVTASWVDDKAKIDRSVSVSVGK